MKKAHFPSPPLSLQTRGRGHQSSLYGGSDGKECACSVGEPGSIPTAHSSILVWRIP